MVTLAVGDNLHASVLVDTHAATHDYVLPRSMPNTVNGTCLASSACEQAKMRTTAQSPVILHRSSRRVYPPIQYEYSYAGNEDMELVPYCTRRDYGMPSRGTGMPGERGEVPDCQRKYGRIGIRIVRVLVPVLAAAARNNHTSIRVPYGRLTVRYEKKCAGRYRNELPYCTRIVRVVGPYGG